MGFVADITFTAPTGGVQAVVWVCSYQGDGESVIINAGDNAKRMSLPDSTKKWSGVLMVQIRSIRKQGTTEGYITWQYMQMFFTSDGDAKKTINVNDTALTVHITSGLDSIDFDMDAYNKMCQSSDLAGRTHSTAMQKARRGFKNINIIGGYGADFAKSTFMYSAPIFGKDWSPEVWAKYDSGGVSEQALVDIIKAAIDIIEYPDGRMYTQDDFINTTNPDNNETLNVMRDVVLARVLCLYSLSLPYISDTVVSYDNSMSLGDRYGCMVGNQAGDCEDATQIAARVWRALLRSTSQDPFVTILKRVALRFQFYIVECTLRHGSIAHITGVLMRDNGGLLVEGTGAVDPFSTNIGSHMMRYDDTYVEWVQSSIVPMFSGTIWESITPTPRRAKTSAVITPGNKGRIPPNGMMDAYGAAVCGMRIEKDAVSTVIFTDKNGDIGVEFSDLFIGSSRVNINPIDVDPNIGQHLASSEKLYQFMCRPNITIDDFTVTRALGKCPDAIMELTSAPTAVDWSNSTQYFTVFASLQDYVRDSMIPASVHTHTHTLRTIKLTQQNGFQAITFSRTGPGISGALVAGATTASKMRPLYMCSQPAEARRLIRAAPTGAKFDRRACVRAQFVQAVSGVKVDDVAAKIPTAEYEHLISALLNNTGIKNPGTMWTDMQPSEELKVQFNEWVGASLKPTDSVDKIGGSFFQCFHGWFMRHYREVMKKPSTTEEEKAKWNHWKTMWEDRMKYSSKRTPTEMPPKEVYYHSGGKFYKRGDTTEHGTPYTDVTHLAAEIKEGVKSGTHKVLQMISGEYKKVKKLVSGEYSVIKGDAKILLSEGETLAKKAVGEAKELIHDGVKWVEKEFGEQTAGASDVEKNRKKVASLRI
jgi:hypothetical protein